MISLRRPLLALPVLLVCATTLPAQVIISEFMADNTSTLADEDNTYPDWIELQNTNTVAVNLAGWSLTDDPTHASRWIFPSTNVAAKGFIVVFASGKNRALPGAPLHTDFNLKASGEYLTLLNPAGVAVTEFSPTFPEQYPDFSYGIAQDITTNVLIASGASARYFIPTGSGLGQTWTQTNFTDTAWPSGKTGIGYETAVSGFAVTNYIASVSVSGLSVADGVIANPAQQIALYTENATTINYLNTPGGGHFGNDRTFPGLTIGIDQNNFVIKATATITIPQAGNWTFGVNSDDGFRLNIGSFSMSYPNPRSANDTLQTFNFPSAGNYALELVFYENGGGSSVELFAAQGAYASFDPAAFLLVGSGGGLEVKAPVVPGGGGASYRPLIGKDVQAEMNGINASAYIRIPFTVSDPTAFKTLNLRMKYDDGFVAYLNGQFVASRNAPASPQWNSAATAAHPNYQAVLFEEINLSDYLYLLKPGVNVLALQGLNQSASDTDFLILPELVQYNYSDAGWRFFSTPSPGSLNGTGYTAFVADTKFSVDRGFFDTPFTLAITSATPSATIIYTTNGSTPSLTNGAVYTGLLTIGGTRVVRAAAVKQGFYPSGVDTQTYIFLNDVIRQSPTGLPPSGWPSSWGANVVDYGMDPDIVDSAAYSSKIIPALKSIPTLSVVTDLPNLFDASTGIYANAAQDGPDWERPASLELIYPDGTPGFHVNMGLRIRGGYSRSTGNPKHAFRVLFRSEYGDSRLNYPLFASQNGADSFDAFDLRTFQNYSWSFEGDYRCIGLRDQWSRDTQMAMGQQGERGDMYHLYIDGQYWGVYNTDERGEASYGANYFGGLKGDYDVVKVDTGTGYTIYATDGNLDAWSRLWRAATNGFSSDTDYYRIQGLNVDGTPNAAYENLLDVDNLIDYMLVIFFTGNIDAPISDFLGNNNPNNIYCIRNRTGLYGGFRFLSHDAEHTLHHESTRSNTELMRDRITGPFAAGDPRYQDPASAFLRSNPQYIFTRLRDNTEFRLRVADRVQKYFFNSGLLTTEGCRARLTVRSNEIYQAMVAESARWGDSKRAVPRNRDVDWVTEMNRVYGDYFLQRPGIVLNQLAANGLHITNSVTPRLNQFGGNVPLGFQLTMSAPAGTVYYTVNGTDPRLRGGQRSPSALAYSGPLTLQQSVHVKARTLNNGVWSALTDVTFYIIRDFKDLLITEIMYHPPGAGTNFKSDDFEFIELKNVAATNVELSGIRFTNGVSFMFPVGTFLAPGQFAVLVSNPTAFTNRYPAVRIAGVFQGQLSNNGERLTMVHAAGVPIFSVAYDTRAPWPAAADGTGFSVAPVSANANPDPDNAANWRASSHIGGSPGADDPSLNIAPIVVNEALTHTDPPQVDTIELYNPTPTNVIIGGWYLTDDRNTPHKFRIPPGKEIGANGYLQFSETDWADPTSTNSFRLNSHGEEIYLFSADTNGTLTGYSDGFGFGAAQNGVTFGRYTNSVGEVQYPAQRMNTLGSANAGPRIGPVVINEIQYHPPIGAEEYVELKSVTNAAVKLYDPFFPTNTWRVNGIGFDFPPNIELPAGGLLLVVGGDPTVFRTRYSVPPNVQIFGPFSGTLQDNGESVALQYPDHPDLVTNNSIVSVYTPYIDVDVVRYDNNPPWPTNAAGYGPPLERRVAAAYGNDPANWRAPAGGGSPGLDNNGNRLPNVSAGYDNSYNSTTFPFALPLAAYASDDGLPDPPARLTTTWSQISGPGNVWFSDPSRTNATAYFPGIGTYVLRLTADDGAGQISDDLTVMVRRPLQPVTLVEWGSVWRYVDDGSDQGTNYASRTFDDRLWAAGPAPLGYGDANGVWPATTNSFGTDPNWKNITTYYRNSFQIPNPSNVTNLIVRVQRDDGILLYLNGTPIFTNNLPETYIGYLTNALQAVGTQDETNIYSAPVPASLLVAGTNVLASEIHQSGRTSSDIWFDLQLTADAYPANQAPSVNAGPDQAINLPAPTSLSGSVTDDGLPIPPGILSFSWTKLSGPGTVTFSNPNALNTTATFSVAGSYVLRLSASDGSVQTIDTLSVSAVGTEIRLESVDFPSGWPEGARIRFNAAASTTYTIQFKDDLPGGSWTKVADVPAQPQPGMMEVYDRQATNSSGRYYRLASPAVP